MTKAIYDVIDGWWRLDELWKDRLRVIKKDYGAGLYKRIMKEDYGRRLRRSKSELRTSIGGF